MNWYKKLLGGSSAVPDGLTLGSTHTADLSQDSLDAAIYGLGQMQQNRGLMLQQGALSGSLNQPGIWRSVGGSAQKAKSIIDPNVMPEMQLSLEDAHALWVAKFGTEWVKEEVAQDAGGFNWMRVAERLQQARLLEYASAFGHYKIIPLSLWK